MSMQAAADDMLKVSGIYVSPIEVETALLSHLAVLEDRALQGSALDRVPA